MLSNDPKRPDEAHSTPSRFVAEETCIASLFDPDARPALRTWRKWKKRRVVPFVKIGRLTFYDVEAVRAALNRFALTPRGGIVSNSAR